MNIFKMSPEDEAELVSVLGTVIDDHMRWDHILAQLAALQWLIHADKMPAVGRSAQ